MRTRFFRDVFFGDREAASAAIGREDVRLTAKDDTYEGSREAEHIIALGGNDRVSSGDGNDVIIGGSGDDSIDGDRGSDRLNGGAGDDMMGGSRGNDKLFGGL